MATKHESQYYIPRSEHDTSRSKKGGDDGGEYTVEAVEAMLEPEGLLCFTNRDPEPVFSDKALIVMAIFESSPANAPRIYRWIGANFKNPRFRTRGYLGDITNILHSDDDLISDNFFGDGDLNSPPLYWTHRPELRRLLNSMRDTDGLSFSPDRHIKHHANKLSQSSPKSPVSSNECYKCQYCSTELTRHFNLKGHLLTHTCPERPYICQTCNARFRSLYNLERHTKLHTGERPHTCDKCGRRFARGDALARHNKGPGGCAGRGSSVGGEDENENAAAVAASDKDGENDAAAAVESAVEDEEARKMREFADMAALEKEEEEREKANNEKKKAEGEASAKANAAKADEGEWPSDTQLSPVAAATPLQASVRRWGKSENLFHLPRIGEVPYHPLESENYEALRGVSRNDNNHHYTQKRLHDSNHTTGLDDPSPGSDHDIEHSVYSPKDNHVSRSDGIACTVLELLLEPQWAPASEGNGLEKQFTEKALIVMAFGHTEIENNTKNWKPATRRISAQNAMQLYHRLPTRLRKRIASAYRAAAEDLQSSKAAHVHLSFQFVHERPTEPTDSLYQGWRVAKDFHLGRDSISPRFALAVSASIEQHLLKVSKSMLYINRVQTDPRLQTDLTVQTYRRLERDLQYLSAWAVYLTQKDIETLGRKLAKLHGSKERRRLRSFEKGKGRNHTEEVHAALGLKNPLLDEISRTLARFTLAAILFLPLSFAASFVGTQAREEGSGLFLWISVPLVLCLAVWMDTTWDGQLSVAFQDLAYGHQLTTPNILTARMMK
jgi:hypothetical protein